MAGDSSESLPTAPETVDREHAVQISLIDALTHAVREARPDEEIASLHERLLEFSRVHFLSEQLLMRLHAYPDHDRHVAEHDRMVSALETFDRQRREGSLDDAVATVDALRATLVGHIEGRDRELHRHLAVSGVGPAAG